MPTFQVYNTEAHPTAPKVITIYRDMSDAEIIAHAEFLSAEHNECSVSAFDGLRLVCELTAKLDVALPIGTRVEIAPHHDLWMRGARFGAITSYSPDGQYVYVKLDKVSSDRKFYVWDIERI